MRTKIRLLLPAASLALVTVAVACTPPTSAPPSNGTTTTSSSTTSSSTTSSTTTTISTTTLPDTTKLYSPTPLDGWGIGRDSVLPDEYVDAVELAGDTVYVGGLFSTAVFHTDSAPRANLMAVQASTGALLPFVADTNGPVMAIATDGASLYIGGDFTTVNGLTRNRLAKLDLATGTVDPAFTPSTGKPVYDMLVLGGKLYIVGEFNTVSGVGRTRAAALDLTTGAVDPTFKPPVFDKRIEAIAANPAGTRLYLGGRFTMIDGVAHAYLAGVDPVTGALDGPAFGLVKDYILDLSVKSDGTMLYGAGGGGFNSAAAWDVTTGQRNWAVRADGDTQAVQYSNGFVYMGFHDGYLGDIHLRVLALDPATGVPDPTFMPQFGTSLPGVYCFDADGNHLVAAGYFPNVDGVGVNGLENYPG